MVHNPRSLPRFRSYKNLEPSRITNYSHSFMNRMFVASTINKLPWIQTSPLQQRRCLIAQHGLVMQFDQKKVPVFHREKDKGTMTVLAWCACMDAMKTSLNWIDNAMPQPPVWQCSAGG